MIRIAYSKFSRCVDVLGGENWLDSERFEISAKAVGSATSEEKWGPMLPTLLGGKIRRSRALASEGHLAPTAAVGLPSLLL